MEPVRAWKHAMISAEDSRFVPLNFARKYTAAEERFVCMCDPWCHDDYKDFMPGVPDMRMIHNHVQHADLSPDGSNSIYGKGCGWYGMKDRAEIDRGYYSYYSVYFVLEVEFYGKIIEHEKGYRAEYQRVLSVRLPPMATVCVDEDPSYPYLSSHSPGCACGCACISDAELAGRLGTEVRRD